MVDPDQLQPLSIDQIEGGDLLVWVDAVAHRTVQLICGWDDRRHPVGSGLDLTG